MSPKETDIQKEIMTMLLNIGIVAWRNPGQARRVAGGVRVKNATTGIPDILGVCRNGRFLGIEVKTQKGRIEDHQEAFHTWISSAGGLVFVARSVEDVISRLPEIVATQPCPVPSNS